MSAIDTTEGRFKTWASLLEQTERLRSGTSLPEARRVVARRIGIAPGTLENLGRGRGKGLRGWIRDKIQAALCRELEAEIARLSHLLTIARLTNSGASAAAISEAESAVANARTMISEIEVHP